MKIFSTIVISLICITAGLSQTSYNIVSQDNSCPSATILGTGSCSSFTFYPNVLKISASLTSNMLTFTATKCDGAAFNGNVYFKESTNSGASNITCGSVINSTNATSTTTGFDYFPSNNGFLSGTRYYTAVYIPSSGINSGKRYYAGTITVSGTTLELNSPLPASPLNSSSLATTSNVTLFWSGNNVNQTGVSYYPKLRDVTTGNLVFDYTNVGSSTSYPATVMPGHDYRWVVQARKNGYVNGESQEFTFSIQANSFNLQLGSCIIANPNPLVQSSGKTFSYSVKNVGNVTFSGTVKLTINRPNGTFDVVDEHLSETIAANQTKTYTTTPSNLDPVANPVGSNYLFSVVYQTNGTGIAMMVSSGSGCSNPLSTSVVADQSCPSCITGQTLSNFVNTGNEGFCAAQYFCGKQIIQAAQTDPTAFINRQDVAKMTTLSLLNDTDIPTIATLTLPTDNFPIPFSDVSAASSEGVRYGKLLMYLQNSDAVTPFDKKKSLNPTGKITRADALKVLLEAYNIDEFAIDNLAPMPYTDVFGTTDQYRYIKKAFELGIIIDPGTHKFRPIDYCKREEFFVMLKRIRTSLAINKPNILDVANYYVPANISPTNIHLGQSLVQGNFTYPESGFSISDIGINLDFGFQYESIQTELPDQYHIFEPLGKGWTHDYNAYIYKTLPVLDLNNNTVSPAQTIVHWGDNSIDIFDASNNPITPDNKNTITVSNASEVQIRTKDYAVYSFDKQGNESNVYRLTSVSDKFGNQTNIVYKTISPATVFLDNTTPTEYPYAIDYVQAPSGRRIVFNYGSNGKINLINFPGVTNTTPRSISFSYGGTSNDKLASFTNARNKTTTYTYGNGDFDGDLLMEVTRPRGNKINIGYDKNNKVANVKAYKTNISSPVSDISVANLPSTWGTDKSMTPSLVDNKTGVWSNISMNSTGLSTSIVSSKANVTITRAYNDASNPSSPTSINRNGTTYTYEYYPNGNIKKRIQPIGAFEQFAYDAYNNLTQYIDGKGNITTYTYSADGRFLQSIQIPSSSGTLTQSFTYYPNGLLHTTTNNEGISTNFTYNNQGDLVNTLLPILGISSSATYDYASRIATSINAKNQITTYGFDPNDNLYAEKDAQNHNTTYDYDDNDNLAVINNAKGQQTTFSYDDYDRVISETFDGKTKSYTYDATTGMIATFTKPSGNGYTYNFDPSTKNLISNGYITNIDYQPQNNLMKSISGGSNPNHILKDFYYDLNNRLKYYTDNYDYTVGYDYDLNGNVSKIYYPFGRDVSYEYDEANRLRKVFLQSGGNTTQIVEYVYTGSRLSYAQYGNGVRTTYGYDNAGRPTSLTTQTNNGTGTTICSYTFEMDNLGNHTKETITEPFATLPSLPTATTNYTYTAGNRILTGGNTTWSFDADGNATTKTGKSLSYDLDDNLTSVTGSTNNTYEYDAFGNRRKAIRNGEEIRYALDINGSMANVLAEIKVDNAGNSADMSFYVYGLGLVARLRSNGKLQYYHSDFRGSVVAMTDINQNITHQYQYDEFGNLTNSQEPANDRNDFRYVGTLGVMHETNDLTFMRARYYDPTIGRFNSEDPIWAANLYPYANNNGVMNVDAGGDKYMTFGEVLDESASEFWDGFTSPYNDAKSCVNTPGINWACANTALNVLTFGEASLETKIAEKVSVEVTKKEIVNQVSQNTSANIGRLFSQKGTQLVGNQGEFMVKQYLQQLYPKSIIKAQVKNGVGKSSFDFLVNNTYYEVKATSSTILKGAMSSAQKKAAAIATQKINLILVSIKTGKYIVKAIK